MLGRDRISVVQHSHIAEVERDGVDLDEDLGWCEMLGKVFSRDFNVFAVFCASEDTGAGGERHGDVSVGDKDEWMVK